MHPGPKGDRGPSSLDWAIELGMAEWGVTVLEADAEADAGDIWATRTFPTRDAGKSSLYRHEVRTAAVDAVVEAVTAVAGGRRSAEPLDYADPRVTGRLRPADAATGSHDRLGRRLDRHRDPPHPCRRGPSGVLDTIAGREFHLFGAHREGVLRGEPGEIVAQRTGAICRATVDGAVWITHLKAPGHFKLPAAQVLAPDVPELPAPIHAPPFTPPTLREISYAERRGVGYLHFDFYNGAMSTGQCRRLLDAYRYARSRKTKVIVLMGGLDFFSNGIHLNVIEAADDPGQESWENLTAINDVVREIVETDSHLVISALTGDAAAGGVPFAMAADHVLAREDVVLNPYYRHMGGLYGSEYWTYLLPRRVGAEIAAALTSAPFEPLATRQAVDIGLLDAAFGSTAEDFRAGVRGYAERLARDTGLPDAARREAPPARAGRAAPAARELPGGGAPAVARLLLRARPQLPRGASPVRVQARRAVCRLSCRVRTAHGHRGDQRRVVEERRRLLPRRRDVRTRRRRRRPGLDRPDRPHRRSRSDVHLAHAAVPDAEPGRRL